MAATTGPVSDRKQLIVDEPSDDRSVTGDDTRAQPPAKPFSIAIRADRWWLVGSGGEDQAGPFATLKELQDFLDWSENQLKKK